MSAYTKKNLKEIEDSGAGSSNNPEVQARFARNHIDSEHLGVSYFLYPPGFRAPFGHTHREQEEAYLVINGGGRMKLNDEIIDVGPWDVIRVAPTTARGFEAGPEGIELIVVADDRPEGGDGEKTDNFWD
jgi:mannose-6-phosphate isomerase-like protein (cupin superfamily)